MRVDDVMSREVIALPARASLKEAARLLLEHRISGVPIVDDRRRLVGVLSESDLVAKEGGEDSSEASKLEARLAGEAMTAPAKTIAPWRSVASAAAQMLAEGVNRLPVVDGDGRLVGIVTRADLVRAFARGDDDIAREIREDVIAGSMRLDERRIRSRSRRARSRSPAGWTAAPTPSCWRRGSGGSPGWSLSTGSS